VERIVAVTIGISDEETQTATNQAAMAVEGKIVTQAEIEMGVETVAETGIGEVAAMTGIAT
jgi:hypothetical protein